MWPYTYYVSFTGKPSIEGHGCSVVAVGSTRLPGEETVVARITSLTGRHELRMAGYAVTRSLIVEASTARLFFNPSTHGTVFTVTGPPVIISRFESREPLYEILVFENTVLLPYGCRSRHGLAFSLEEGPPRLPGIEFEELAYTGDPGVGPGKCRIEKDRGIRVIGCDAYTAYRVLNEKIESVNTPIQLNILWPTA